MAESIAPIPLTASGVEQISPERVANRAFRCAYPVQQFRAFWAVTKRFRWLRISGEVKFRVRGGPKGPTLRKHP